MVRNNSKLVTTELLNSINATLENSNISSKSKYRYLAARSERFEKQIAELLQALSIYARRNAKLRDSGDNVSEAINSIVTGEVLSLSLKKTLAEVAKSLRNIQDHRDSEVLYFEDKLLKQFADLGRKVHKQRDEMKSKAAKLSDTRNKSAAGGRGGGGGGWTRSGSGENVSSRRRSKSLERPGKVSKEERQLQSSIQKCEYHRNVVMKKLLLKLVLSELRFTIKTFNNLTTIYRSVGKHCDPNEDLKLFNEFFNFRDTNIVNEDDEEDNEDIENEDEEEEEEEENEDDKESTEDDDEEEEDSVIEIDNKNQDNKKNKNVKQSKFSLRRFNSSPEVSSGSDKGDADLAKPKTDTAKATNRNKLNNSISKTKTTKSEQSTLSSRLIRNKLFSSKNVKGGKHAAQVSESEDDEVDEDEDEDEDVVDKDDEDEVDDNDDVVEDYDNRKDRVVNKHNKKTKMKSKKKYQN